MLRAGLPAANGQVLPWAAGRARAAPGRSSRRSPLLVLSPTPHHVPSGSRPGWRRRGAACLHPLRAAGPRGKPRHGRVGAGGAWGESAPVCAPGTGLYPPLTLDSFCEISSSVCRNLLILSFCGAIWGVLLALSALPPPLLKWCWEADAPCALRDSAPGETWVNLVLLSNSRTLKDSQLKRWNWAVLYFMDLWHPHLCFCEENPYSSSSFTGLRPPCLTPDAAWGQREHHLASDCCPTHTRYVVPQLQREAVRSGFSPRCLRSSTQESCGLGRWGTGLTVVACPVQHCVHWDLGVLRL